MTKMQLEITEVSQFIQFLAMLNSICDIIDENFFRVAGNGIIMTQDT